MIRHALTVATTTLLALAACAAPAGPDVASIHAASRRGGRTPPPRVARPCRADSLFVEVPLQVDLPWSDLGFLSSVRSELASQANAPSLPWFCGTGQTTCPSGSVGVELDSLLEERASPEIRADGHLRFFRASFFDSTTGDPLAIRPGAQCEVVATLRDSFDAFSGLAGDELHVGRECDASSMDVQSSATEEMRGWHLDRLGLRRVFATTPPDPLAERVDLALVDTGVEPSLASAIGVASTTDLSAGGPLHPHASEMGALIRQVAADASILDVRVMAATGSAEIGVVARGVDEALFGPASAGGHPLVINLSLGWPAQLGEPARLTGEACETHEDPVGESVRYGLYLASRLDEEGVRPVFVAAASGNRPGPAHDDLFPPAPAAPTHECGPQTFVGDEWFFPGQWHRLDSCMFGDGAIRRLGVGIGAVDDRDRPSGVGIAGSESPLVAPGQHVYASHPSVATSAGGPWCTTSPPPYPTPFALPRAVTGTSVSAALTAAAAARSQATRLSLGQMPLDQGSLARLLYLTGESVCDATGPRTTPTGTPVRRLHVGRLDEALQEPTCAALVTCAESATGLEPIAASLLNTCRHELDSCGLETVDATGQLEVSCPAPRAVPWPQGYAETATMCESGVLGGSPFVDTASCPAAGCPHEARPFGALVGSLGPQPNNPTCHDCTVFLQGHDITAVLELNHEFEPGTIFEQPFLVVSGPVGSTFKKYYVDLSTIVPMASWEPGASLELEVGTGGIDPSFGWAEAQAVLVVFVQEPFKEPVNDYSPLHIEL